MKTFNNWSTEDFNSVFDTNLKTSMTFQEVDDEIMEKGVSFFYISMDKNDVLEAIEDEKEVAEALDLRLTYIEDLGIYIATY